MKKVYKDKIVQIDGDFFDERLFFDILIPKTLDNKRVVYLKDELEKRKNIEILEKVRQHPAMWSEVYSPKDELEIFSEIFQQALKNGDKVHIVGITLEQEIKMLEEYYSSLGFFNKEINCYNVDFSKVQISASIYMENLMWRGSDYKKMGDKIFFCPPIRESGQVKALFTGINRGVISGIYMDIFLKEYEVFLNFVIGEEYILPLMLSKILFYNFLDFGFIGKNSEFIYTSKK